MVAVPICSHLFPTHLFPPFVPHLFHLLQEEHVAHRAAPATRGERYQGFAETPPVIFALARAGFTGPFLRFTTQSNARDD